MRLHPVIRDFGGDSENRRMIESSDSEEGTFVTDPCTIFGNSGNDSWENWIGIMCKKRPQRCDLSEEWTLIPNDGSNVRNLGIVVGICIAV